MSQAGISPTLFKTQNLILDAIHKLDRAEMSMSRRASDPVRTSNNLNTQALRYSERELAGCLILIAGQLEILRESYASHCAVIRNGGDDFSQVHRLLNTIRRADETGDDFQ